MKELIIFLKEFHLTNNFTSTQLLIILFLISIGKSTIFLSSFLPPASIMLINFVIFSLSKINSFLICLSISLGSTIGSIISYYLGKKANNKNFFNQYLKKYKLIINKTFYKLKKKETLILLISKFIAILRYIIPFSAGILLIKKEKVYIISFISSVLWSIFFILISKLYLLFLK